LERRISDRISADAADAILHVAAAQRPAASSYPYRFRDKTNYGAAKPTRFEDSDQAARRTGHAPARGCAQQ
jgi:hypothetical protein